VDQDTDLDDVSPAVFEFTSAGFYVDNCKHGVEYGPYNPLLERMLEGLECKFTERMGSFKEDAMECSRGGLD